MPFSEVDEEALPLDSPWPESVGSGAVAGKLRLQAASSLGRNPHAGVGRLARLRMPQPIALLPDITGGFHRRRAGMTGRSLKTRSAVTFGR
jgi:hypothetical protein